jgi:hypothetical protein
LPVSPSLRQESRIRSHAMVREKNADSRDPFSSSRDYQSD